MDAIPYINDLIQEIRILNNLKNDKNNADIDEKINNKQQKINDIKQALSELSNNQICYKLYLYILNGMSPSKAIEKISEENMMNGIKPTDISTLWKNYYKKIKKYL